jgi:oxygen-independent coproporphyrinogen-3 oxidase
MPDAWLAAAERGNGDKVRAKLAPEDEVTEFLLMGLRLADGIDLKRYEILAGHSLPRGKVEHLVDIGMITVDGPRMRCTAAGRMVLNSVIATLLE